MTERVRNIIILGTGCIVIFCVWLFSSPNSEFSDPPMETAEYYQPAPTPGSDLTAIEANSDIKIPSSAREIHARISGFRELDVWVRFDLPENDLSSFLKGTLCELPLNQIFFRKTQHPG